MSEEELRKKFRAWMLSDGFPEVVLKEDGEGEFCYGYTGNMWAAFKAGASLSTEERGEVVYGEFSGLRPGDPDIQTSYYYALVIPECGSRQWPFKQGDRLLISKEPPVTIRRPKEEG
jgi:hypothetical protein